MAHLSVADLVRSFELHLRAENKSDRTIETYRSLRVFYSWLEAEGETPVGPMAKMRPPSGPDQPVPLVREDAFRRILEACAGRGFEARRDTALILLLVDVDPPRRGRGGLRLSAWIRCRQAVGVGVEDLQRGPEARHEAIAAVLG